MPSTIDRYITATYLSSYLILVAVGIGLYVLSDLLFNIDEFTRDVDLPFAQVLGLMADFYGANTPLYYAQLTGPMMAFAAAFTFGYMLRNNELVAMVAAGVPLRRLALPVVIATLALIVAAVVNREMIVPAFAEKIGRSRHELFSDTSDRVPVARDAAGVIVTANRLFKSAGRMEEVLLIEPDVAGKPDTVVQADAAVYDPDAATWVLERGVRYRLGEPLGPSNEYAILNETVTEFPLRLTPGELALRRNAEWAEYLSLQQISNLLRSPHVPNRGSVATAMHVRATQPMLQFILVLLTIPFFLTREKANVLVSGGWSLLLSGTFFASVFVAQNVLTGGGSDSLAAWLPILVFGPIAVVNMFNIRT